MSGNQQAQLSNALQQKLGAPDGFKLYSPFPFAGVNQQASRLAIEDKEFFWTENFLRLGDGNLRTLWDQGPALYTAPAGRRIIYFAFYNIGTTYYAVAFLDNGTAVQVNQDTGAVTTISATALLFYTGAQLPAVSQSGGQYLLIANNNTANDYWIWDGSVLYGAGTLGPTITLTSSGSGYTSPPTVTAVGGAGTGATFVASIANGAVTGVTVTDPGTGYVAGDQVQLVFSGGGSDNGAVLTAVLATGAVAHLNLIAGGAGYTSVPTVNFSAGAATATATLTATSLGSIAVTAGGAGYTTAPSVIITGGGGIGATATATLTAGVVTDIVITAAGLGYTTPPNITLTGGGGTGATATATLSPTSVATVSLTAGGSGYTTTPTVSFTGGGGSGAQAVALLTPGAVTSVTVVNGGSGFTGTPTLSFVGGGGSGATATANLTSGVISSVSVTAGGSGYTSTPTVVVSSGSNNSAAGTIEIMPFGVSGSAIEVYLTRVWLTHPHQGGLTPTGNVMTVSAPGSLVDFATSDGGLSFPSRDRFLRAEFKAIRQSNGYLYAFGDSSANVISNVQTAGTPSTTTFNYQNTDPQVGTNYRDSFADYGRTILFTNQLGVYGLYGGAVTKVSGKMDRIFQNAVFPPTAGAITPSAAAVSIFKIKCYAVLMSVLDPLTKTVRTMLLLWNEKDWFPASQSVALIQIANQTRNSNLTAWGTDGTSIYPLFNTPSTAVPKKLASKLYGADAPQYQKLALKAYVYAEDNTVGQPGVTFNLYTDWSVSQVVYPVNPVPSPFNPLRLNGTDDVGNAYVGTDLSAPGTDDVGAAMLGFTITSQSPDFSVYHLALGYQIRSWI